MERVRAHEHALGGGEEGLHARHVEQVDLTETHVLARKLLHALEALGARLALCMLSMTVTSCPSPSISSTVWLPMKPAPPVTRTFMALLL